ncbi:ATP-binding protein [Archangium violaceum]|uniref:histidine kinase n=1 Tax=Archangium violaceum Cb vi76 TaxID=1406225 RepID=A0A084SV23_9BACT|nr:ATP-binding protein [Archangium violaceum]KFA92308.1 histidine kinase [Archangium violaceum Cb vi76]
MAVRIGVVIALTTLVSYLHILRTMRDESLEHLARHVEERVQREQAIFVLSEETHALIKKAFEERLQATSQEDPTARFHGMFERRADGTIRTRPQGFDGTRVPGVWITPGVKVDTGFQRRVLAAYDVMAQYGPAYRTRHINTFIVLTEGVNVLYWPEVPNWTQDVGADYPLLSFEYFTLTRPQENPLRQVTWTRSYKDDTSGKWLLSAVTPVDQDGQHVATLGNDVLVDELLSRTLIDHLPGAHNLIFRDDGQLVAHPEIKLDSLTGGYDILAPPKPEGSQPGRPTAEQQAHLRSIFEAVKRREPGQTVVELPEYDEYIAVAQLRGPGWNFVTVLPESVVTSKAIEAARYVLVFGLVSLLVELLIMFWVLREQLSRPLQAFTQATAQVTAGDFGVSLETSRQDELGQLARSFERMAQEVRQREEALRQANEGLEQRVEERTRELKEVHQQLLQTARQAGMAEIATNVLHNVGNVLNSVYTAAQLARERMLGMKLEHVGRVAHLLQEHQGELNTFVTQDDRGRNLLPFLDKLGKNLLDDRGGMLELLGDIGRYTEHIGDIVKVQQNHARMPRLQEAVSLTELVEDALRINEAGLSRHQVKVERQLAPIPPVLTDKHKVLMILVNLFSNAKYAMDAIPPEERRLTVKLEHSAADRVRIEVRDTGVGIAPEQLTRIFQYGFTTRQSGHGFGLHSSAVAAQEMGGSLTVHSEGAGHGATFILELPLHSTGLMHAS